MRGLLVYPISADHLGNLGILNKMAYQRAAFEALLGPSDLVHSSTDGPIVNGDPVGRYLLRGRATSALNHYGAFYLHAARLAKNGAYDFIYIRYPLALPGFLWFLEQARRANPGAPVVVEIATFPYRKELQSTKQRVLRLLDDLGHNRLRKHVDAIVTFYGQDEIYGIPCVRSANGIDLSTLRLRVPARPKRGIDLITVGNLAHRHGIDRTLHGIREYAQSGAAEVEPVTLNIVGDGPVLPALRSLVTALDIQRFVRFHGMLNGNQLDEVFDLADVALDSLGLHRLQLRSSSSLKAREYCGRGVPFVFATHDPDFPPDLDFVLRVPSDESALDIASLIAFAKQMREARSAVDTEMRHYAESHLSWEAKLEPVARYLVENRAGAA